MKKFLAWFLPALLAIGLAVTLGFLVETRNAHALAEQGLNDQVQAIYRQTQDNLNDMETDLSKLQVVSSQKQQCILLSRIWRLSASTTTALAQLPATHPDNGSLMQFVTRAGDYCNSLFESLLSGGRITADDEAQLESLRQKCGELADELRRAVEDGAYPDWNLPEDGGFYAQTKDEGDITEYPQLIYDGPFSESHESAEARGLTGAAISESEAKKRAEALLPSISLQSMGEVPGTIPCYMFSGEDANGEVYVSITKTGGHVLSFMRQPTGDSWEKPTDAESQALHAVAQAFLTEQGYGEMEPSYAQYYAGEAVLNYAAIQDGVILYADLIKVYVDRESREVMGMDAQNYYMSHRARTLTEAVLTEEEAKEAADGKFEIQQVKLALIPKTAQTEILCYEIKGIKDGTYFIVYVNVENGNEEEVFKVIDSSEGDLVI